MPSGGEAEPPSSTTQAERRLSKRERELHSDPPQKETDCLRIGSTKMIKIITPKRPSCWRQSPIHKLFRDMSAAALALHSFLASSTNAFFDSALEDCQKMQSVSEGLLAANLPADCPVRNLDCAEQDFCIDCSWDGWKAGRGCADGCGYCDKTTTNEGMCVTRIGGMSLARGFINGNEFVVTTYLDALNYRLAAEDFAIEYEGFHFSWDPSGAFDPLCTVKFMGQECSVCQLRYCGAAQTTTGYYADCTAIEGGDVFDQCNPLTLQDYDDANLSLMKKILLLPAWVCSQSSEETSSLHSISIGSSGSILDVLADLRENQQVNNNNPNTNAAAIREWVSWSASMKNLSLAALAWLISLVM